MAETIHAVILILAIVIVVGTAKFVGMVLDARRLRHWSDDDIDPPPWQNDVRPHHGRCRRGAWHDRNHP